MKNALILHGTSSTSESSWFSWLKGKLEADGWKVWAPDLPGADKPNIRRYNEFLLSKDWALNEESIIVGHSSGAVGALGLLQALPEGTKIRAAILVGAFHEHINKHKLRAFFRRPLTWHTMKVRYNVWRQYRRGELDLSELFETPLDFDIIRTRAEKFVLVHSDDDPYCPLAGATFMAKELGGELTVVPGQKHFSVGTAGEQYREFPLMLDIIEKL